MEKKLGEELKDTISNFYYQKLVLLETVVSAAKAYKKASDEWDSYDIVPAHRCKEVQELFDALDRIEDGNVL